MLIAFESIYSLKRKGIHLESYRPISLLCVPYKILKRFIYAPVDPLIDQLFSKELSLAYRGSLDPDHIVWFFKRVSDACQERLRSRRPFVPAVQNLLDNLAGFGIVASQWTNHKWNVEHCENFSRLRVFILRTRARSVGMSLSRKAWVRLNCLRTDFGRFHSSMHKWSLAPSLNFECGASEQTEDHVVIAYPIHGATHGTRGLTVLDDETQCGLNNITASILSGQCSSSGE